MVSENSMGFHNPSEVSSALHNALALAQSAKQKAEDANGGAPSVTCSDYGEGSCGDYPEDCRWNRNKGCINR